MARPAARRPRLRARSRRPRSRGWRSCASPRSRSASRPTWRSGRHAELVGELEALVARAPAARAPARPAHARALPLRPPGRGARASTGTRARALVEELGIEPGRALRELEQAILAQDADARPRRARPRQAPSAGREPSSAASASSTSSARSTTRSRARRAVPARRRARDRQEPARRGARARTRGRAARACSSGAAGRPAARRPTGRGCRRCARTCARPTPEALRAQLGPRRAELATILPELRELLPDLPPPRPPTPRARASGCSRRSPSLLRARPSAQPLALVLDDLHAADAPSLLLLRFVAGRARAARRSSIVGCYRDTEVGPELADALAELAREPARAPGRARRASSRADTARLLELDGGHAPAGAISPRRCTRRRRATRCSSARSAGCWRRRRAAERPATGCRSPRRPRGDRPPAAAPVRRLPRRCSRSPRSSAASSTSTRWSASAAWRGRALRGARRGGGRAARRRGARRARSAALLPRPHPRRALRGPARHAAAAPAPASRRGARGAARRRTSSPHLAELAHHYLEAGSGAAPSRRSTTPRRAGDRAAAPHGLRGGGAPLLAARSRCSSATGVGDCGRTCDLLLALGDALSRAGDAPRRARRRCAAPPTWPSAALGRPARARGAAATAAASRGRAPSTDPALVPLLERGAGGGRATTTAPSRVRLLAPARRRARATSRCTRAPRRARPTRRSRSPSASATRPPSAYALEGSGSRSRARTAPRTALAVGDELIALGRADRRPGAGLRGPRLPAATRFWTPTDRAGVDVELDALAQLAEELRQPAQHWHRRHPTDDARAAWRGASTRPRR